MKINSIILALALGLGALAMTGCGSSKSATNGGTSSQTVAGGAGVNTQTVAATTKEWKTISTGGKITLGGKSSMSSSMQMKMERGKSISLSLRPFLGIEVAKLYVHGDSLLLIDKVHKLYVADKVSVLTSGVPMDVTIMQDIFLGSPFVLGQGTFTNKMAADVTLQQNANGYVLKPKKQYSGFDYSFNLRSDMSVSQLVVSPVGKEAAYSVDYADPTTTQAGIVAKQAKIAAKLGGTDTSMTLNYNNIQCNSTTVDRTTAPSGYKRISMDELFGILKNYMGGK